MTRTAQSCSSGTLLGLRRDRWPTIAAWAAGRTVSVEKLVVELGAAQTYWAGGGSNVIPAVDERPAKAQHGGAVDLMLYPRLDGTYAVWRADVGYLDLTEVEELANAMRGHVPGSTHNQGSGDG